VAAEAETLLGAVLGIAALDLIKRNLLVVYAITTSNYSI
jgi:hypothetical protein